MKNKDELKNDRELKQMIKAYLRSTGDLIPKFPDEIAAFEKRNIKLPFDVETEEDDPAIILKRGYIPYEINIKKEPSVFSEPKSMILNLAARNGVKLSEHSEKLIRDLLASDEQLAKENPPTEEDEGSKP